MIHKVATLLVNFMLTYMRLLSFWALVCGCLAGVAEDYANATALLASVAEDPGPWDLKDVVLAIPPYHTPLKSYNSTGSSFTTLHPLVLQAIELLQRASKELHVPSIVTLADLYIFGNHSVPTDYQQALNLYHQAIDLESNGHAYFMLGFIYSTGLFGEVELNQAKAQVYYQLGLEAGDVNSLLAMAYRLVKGIGCPKDFELASVYYSKLTKIGYEYLLDHYDSYEPTEVTYNVRIPDFIGGIYGKDVSETAITVTTSRKKLLYEYEQEYNMDSFDKEIVFKFFSALDEYDGHYLVEKNHTKAKQLLEQCVAYGTKIYGYKNPSSISLNDRFRFSQCEALLGHMYLHGQGVEKDYEKAFSYLTDLMRFYNSSDSLNDLGLIYHYGYVDQPDHKTAIQLYSSAIQLESEKAARNMAKLLISNVTSGDIISSNKKADIVLGMKHAAINGDTEALYHFFEFIQSGYTKGITKDYSTEGALIFPKVFIERLHAFFFPHLRYAMIQLSKKQYKNALLAYLLAAEQGLERAQVSAGWLLYQSDNFGSKPKSFDYKRVQSAITYFKRASDQRDIDATIFLGDLYYYGVKSANISVDYEEALVYYKRASVQKSSHGCFNLAYMYEYGLGVVGGSDLYMAKKYYDLALTYREQASQGQANQIPIYLALFKLRIKHLIWGGKDMDDGGSWVNAFKKIGIKEQEYSAQLEEDERRAEERAREQHEGGTDIEMNNDELIYSDYFAIGITIVMFAVAIRNMIQQFRFPRNRAGAGAAAGEGVAGAAAAAGEGAEAEGVAQQGWRFNGAQANFRRGNFEFHFMAL